MERPVRFGCIPSARNEKIWLKEKRANDSTSSIVLQELTRVLTSFNQSLLPSPYVGSFWAWWSRNMSSRGTETRTSFLSCFDNVWRTLYIERAPALYHYSFFFLVVLSFFLCVLILRPLWMLFFFLTDKKMPSFFSIIMAIGCLTLLWWVMLQLAFFFLHI